MKKTTEVILLTVLLLVIDFTQGVAQQSNLPKDTVAVAGCQYNAGWLKRKFFGSHYRKEWITPVKVNVFDIDTVEGGMKVIKQGGSWQTTSLRLVNKEGRQFVLRSVNKTPTRALPKELQHTVAVKILQDQTSAENPYGPLVIPSLANAAGIYHSNPRLYYIPYDTSFKEFASTMAGTLAYFEERPDEDLSDAPNFGNSKNVIGTTRLFENVYADHDNKVDQAFYLKTRFFDMWIGDWGRHEDQWRWASYKTKNGKLYRPIPRDRDHVFFKFDGIIPHLVNKKRAFRHFVDFDYKLKNVMGLNKSATSLDRAILTELNEEDWIKIAEELKSNLTDSVIVASVHQLPENIFHIHGPEIIAKLKSRREKLTKAAKKYYSEFSKKVDIVGSDKKEFFLVKGINNKNTGVWIFRSKDHKDTLYHRIFNSKETKEIRLIGLGGKDTFLIEGKAKKGLKIRIVGGEGEDSFIDRSSVGGLRKKNVIYDTESGNNFILNNETKVKSSDDPSDSINNYNRSSFFYDYYQLTPSIGYNPDDYIIIGLGLMRKTSGFHKSPYSSTQRIFVNYTTGTSALIFRYLGDFIKLKGDWNLRAEVRIFGPRFALNYFGFGNESIQRDTLIKFYRVRGSQVFFSPMFYKEFNKHIEAGIGPRYQYININLTPGRFITTPEAGLGTTNFQPNHYLGASAYIKISNLGKSVNPTNGVRWFMETGAYSRINDPQQYLNINSNVSYFYTPKLPVKMTFATRIGGAHNFGKFDFYQANTLGGTTNLRGFRRTRFYGRSSFYHNTDVRIKIADVNFFLFSGTIGLIGFYDYGRVWADGEKSNKIHSGYGPGAYIQILNRALLSATYGFSEDASYLNVIAGFLF